MPVLVYLFRISPVLATAYSLFIVGVTSLVGTFPKYKLGLVNLKTAMIFGAPAITAVYITRKFILPNIPDDLFAVGEVIVTKSIMMMLLFAVMMVFAAISMIREKEQNVNEQKEEQRFNYTMILLEGAIVGVLTGLVGAGGGFLIIPALVLFSKLPMKQAVGTSLLIIAAKSLIGFLGDISNYTMNWKFLLITSGLAISGIFIGNRISHKLSGEKLKKAFGWFVLVMGFYIIIKELFFP